MSRGDVVAPPAHVDPDSDAKRVPAVLWLLLLLALVAVGHDALAQSGWFGGFVRSLGDWLAHPATSLNEWHPRWPPLREVSVGVVFVAVGTWVSLILLQCTRLKGDRVALVGFVPIMTVATAGLVGTVLVAVSQVSFGAMSIATVLLVVGLTLVTLRRGGANELLRSYRRRNDPASTPPVRRSRLERVGQWWIVGVVGLVLALVTLRDLISPIVEWDATVYHSELARLWFLQAPHPPLVFGPSLGVQISANYPPLFPASGLVANLAAGRVTDVAVRLASPGLFLGLLLVVFSFARLRFGERTAWWSVLLLGTTPLMVLYASWSTSYVLTTALGFVAVCLCIEAVEATSHARRLWIVTGIVLGLAILSSFYGWLFLLVMVPAALARRAPLRGRTFDGLAMVLALGAVAGVWLLRDWIELGDPLYPLSIPFFHARGLTGPLWSAAQQELRVNANSYWIGSHDFLRLRQLLTELFDRHLLVVGTLPVVLLFWRRHVNRVDQRLIALAAVVLLAAELAPGWFWLRSLLPAMPFLAIAGGVALGELGRFAGRRPRANTGSRWKSISAALFRGGTGLLFLTVTLVGSGVALALAVAGPGQGTWTTQLPSSADFMTLDRTLGSTSGTLWSVFGGDYQAWNWLNEHSTMGRVATFDIRAQYLDHPGSIFYLDGEGAKPLLSIDTPSAALAFFQHHDVRYVFVPAWSTGPGDASDPAVDLLPLHRFLGDRDFPLAASFAPSASFPLSNVYQVGGSVKGVQPALLPGPSSPAPGPRGPYVFASESDDGWIFAPLVRRRPEQLRITYFDSSKETIYLNAYVSNGTWDLDIGTVKLRGSHRWREATIPLPSSTTGIAAVSVNVGRGDFRVKSAVVDQHR